MNLYELAFGCWVYRTVSGDDSRVTELREATGGQLDPYNPAHRRFLFKWLNQWGCRQFSKAHHETAGQSLETWASKQLSTLPAKGVTLEAIDPVQIDTISKAYDELRRQEAGTRTLATGAISHVMYGPVGAAKTLFALRPTVCPPWDSYTLDTLGINPYSSASYGQYLRLVLSDLQTVSAEAGVPIAELPGLLGRSNSTPPKIIDEYYWVTITKGFRSPSPETLHQWLEWANLD